MVYLYSKYGELKKICNLLSNFENQKPTNNKTKNFKGRILNNINQLYNKYFDTYKRKYDSENLNKRDEKYFDPNQFKIIKKEFEEKTDRKIQKLVQFKIFKMDV